jgi:hypothetical protein
MSFTHSKRFFVAALLITLGSAGNSFAQQSRDSVGMVRISSPKTSSLMKTSGQGVQQVGGHRMAYAETPCQTGNCPQGNGVAMGGYPCDSCPTGNCPGGCPGGCFHGKFGEHYCKHSPDYGYSPPAKYPLHRRGAEYTHYYPMNWYGAGADYSGSYAPMVYQPTDTTQLGYKYQHVPFWQPMPNRIPPRPIPAQWHSTPAPVAASAYGRHGWGHRAGVYAGMNGYCPPTTTISPTPAPQMSTQPLPVQNSAPLPLESEVVPPVQSTSPIDVIDSGIGADADSSAAVGSEPGALPPSPTTANSGNRGGLK